MSSILQASGLSYEFANGRVLFTDLSLSLEPKLTALVGPNGVGKTCLARLLSGDWQPSAGAIRRHAAITFFPQREEPPAQSVEAFLSEHYSWSLLGEKLLAGIDDAVLCPQLSGGQWMRVRLARAIDEGFLILDEPTNDLDREGRAALLEFLRETESGALLISHDRECLRLCSDVLELSNRGLARFGGGWEAYEAAKERERASLAGALETAKREREEAFAERHAQIARQEKRNRHGTAAAARGGMPKILLGGRKRRAQATTGRVDRATLERANDAVREAFQAFEELKIDPVMYADLAGKAIPSGKLVAEARGFNIRFDDWLYTRDLAFSWRGNVRVALKGPNGSGKSTLLKAITGERLNTRGEFRRGELVTLYLDQRGSALDATKSVFENVRVVSMATESEIRNGLAKFLFAKDSVFQPVHSLSGGERLRAALACGLLATSKPELLILDEPTNNLDLANITFLENLVREFRGALLVISHDEEFLQNSGVTDSFLLAP